MATYKEVKGVTIQTKDGDPDIFAGVWSSGGNLNTSRGELSGTAGIQTAGLVFGGTASTYLAVTESYDGTSWTEVNDLNTARGTIAGAGTYTAAIAAGGAAVPTYYNNTETWNGSSWTEVN